MCAGQWCLTVVCIAVMCVASPIAENDVAGTAPGIVVYVTDYADVPRHVLQPALRQVTRAFLHVAIPIRWHSTSAPPRPRRAWEYTVVMLSPEMVRRKGMMDGIESDVAARSAPAAGRAWIFADRVRAASEQRAMPAADMLGKVITHELGHLLLGTGPSNRLSVMQEQLSLRVGGYRFTQEQGIQMRQALRTADAPPLVAEATLTPE